MFTTYILQSIENGRYYIGYTSDIVVRLERHNSGLGRSTKSFTPWEIAHIEKYDSKTEARKRELEIKSYKGGIKFKRLLGLWKD